MDEFFLKKISAFTKNILNTQKGLVDFIFNIMEFEVKSCAVLRIR